MPSIDDDLPSLHLHMDPPGTLSRLFGQCYASNFVGIVQERPIFYSSMTALKHKARSKKRWLDGDLMWKNLTGPHSALTSTPLNTFGMKWKFRAMPSGLTSVPDLTNILGKNSHKNTPKCCGKPSQKSGGCYCCKEGTNSILMSMYIIKVPDSVMARCPCVHKKYSITAYCL